MFKTIVIALSFSTLLISSSALAAFQPSGRTAREAKAAEERSMYGEKRKTDCPLLAHGRSKPGTGFTSGTPVGLGSKVGAGRAW